MMVEDSRVRSCGSTQRDQPAHETPNEKKLTLGNLNLDIRILLLMPLDDTLDTPIIRITNDVPRRRTVTAASFPSADDEVVQHVSAHPADADEADGVLSRRGEELEGGSHGGWVWMVRGRARREKGTMKSVICAPRRGPAGTKAYGCIRLRFVPGVHNSI